MNELKKLIDNIAAKAQELSCINLEDIIDDVDHLTVALCTSNLNVIARTLSFSNTGETRYVAAHKALDIGWNPSIREELAKKAYFADNLRALLKLAECDPITGSRLMPVFEEAVEIHKDLCLPKKLLCKLKNFITEKLESDGFSIGNINEEGKTPVNIASWVEEKLKQESSTK